MPTGGVTSARPRHAPSRHARPRRRRRAGAVAGIVVGAVVLAAVPVAIWWLARSTAGPGSCEVTSTQQGDAAPTAYTLTPEQARNAATIAAVGLRLGLPDHAVTIALAAALQESKLRNLSYGDRDSLGLFQQRPSQGWGSPDQISDPAYAATVFYQRLRSVPGWQTLSVTGAAQRVQHSDAPDAYARWEGPARVAAAALTGETAAGLTCRGLDVSHPTGELAAVAENELGTRALSGAQPPARGWAIGSWLVAHAADLGVSRVGFGGRTWTAESGRWAQGGGPTGVLVLSRTAP